MPVKSPRARPGKLRQRIAIQTATTATLTAANELIESWSTTTTVWGSYSETGSLEVEENDKVELVATGTVVIRYYSTLAATMRLVMNGRTFRIAGFRNFEERNTLQEIDVIEVT